MNEMLNKHPLYGLQIKYAKHLGGGGSKTKIVDPYAGTGIRELYKDISGWLQPQIGQGISPYAGQMVAGESPLQQMGFDLARQQMGMLPGMMGMTSQLMGGVTPSTTPEMMGLGTGALQNIMAPYDPTGAQQFWQQAFVNPAMQNWSNIQRQVMEPYAGRNAADSGAMQRALAREGTRMTTDLSGQLANILYSGQQAHLGRQLSGLGPTMNMAMMPGNILQQALGAGGMGTDILGQMLGFGAQQRGITGEMLQEPYQKWQFSQPWANPYLNILPMALSQPGMTVVDQEQGPGAAALFGPLLNYAGTPAGNDLLSTILGGGKSGFLGGYEGAGGLLGAGGELLGGLGGLASGGLSGLGGLASGGIGAIGSLLAMI